MDISNTEDLDPCAYAWVREAVFERSGGRAFEQVADGLLEVFSSILARVEPVADEVPDPRNVMREHAPDLQPPDRIAHDRDVVRGPVDTPRDAESAVLVNAVPILTKLSCLEELLPGVEVLTADEQIELARALGSPGDQDADKTAPSRPIL
ncbi:hypothetical protein CO174_03825 [Candidatus Uhrbacteria bacterium CG_4_9_14_3_um_filter_50_9]|uniref:Uncharacterized protein n=1 Tax=Candidatus Uhrbacteria bacterium CG_4_9_14_3_um_filter_50_9 TaxID=1975035 RepID=A0A2M7XC52_9BACT|nr:MAG: hypothetical protein CO174_03825 [Candidatus Uhrbacteria bacterium CG_4_9_14_3_um_filter_50_9]